MAYGSGRQSTHHDDTEGLPIRQETTYVKMKGSMLWILSNQAAGRIVREKFSSDPKNPPIYIPIGREEKVLEDLVLEGIPVVLSGPPGIGKTTLIRSVFHRLDIPLQTYLASAASQVHEMLGRQSTGGVDEEYPIWSDGKLSLAARAAAGGTVNGFYLDEVIKLPMDIASVLYSVIDSRQSLPLPTGEEIHMGGKLKMAFSYNPSKHVHLEDALRSRLTAIRIGYPPAKVEERVLMEESIGTLCRHERGPDIARGYVKYANIIRHAHGYEVDCADNLPTEEETRLLRILPGPPSIRSLVVASRMVAKGEYVPQDALDLFVIPSLVQDTHDYELPKLMRLLEKMGRELIPKVEERGSLRSQIDASIAAGDERLRSELEASEIAARVLREWKRGAR